MSYTKVVNVYRGSRLESSHVGHAAVVDGEGKLLYSVGDWQRFTYIRSTSKPFQTIPVIETGAAEHYNLEDRDLALFCSSHSGEEQHTTTVSKLLSRSNLTEDYLQCGTHIPYSDAVYRNLIRQGNEPTPIYNNCSGKHTGMLLTGKYLEESLDDYYLEEHTIQQRIKTVISEVSNYPEDKIGIGIDGCGVPVFALPLNKLATAYASLAEPIRFDGKRANVIRRIASSMTKHPEMVAGTNRFCTDFMRVGKGRFIGKLGAESVYCVSDKKTGIGIAVKIEDGDFTRALYPFVMEIMVQLGLLTDEQIESLKEYHQPKIRNAKSEVVGEVLPSFQLQKVN